MPTRLTLANISRTVARIGSILVILLGIPFLLFVGLQVLSGEPANPAIFISLLLLAGMIAGMVIAWRREGLGATLTLISIAGYFFLSGTFPGVGSRQGFPLFVGPINLLFALLIPGYHLEMSPEARWVPFISWVLSITPVALFLASWWLQCRLARTASLSGG
jgi:hypothetical protein